MDTSARVLTVFLHAHWSLMGKIRYHAASGGGSSKPTMLQQGHRWALRNAVSHQLGPTPEHSDKTRVPASENVKTSDGNRQEQKVKHTAS